jgi:hypothetical protein
VSSREAQIRGNFSKCVLTPEKVLQLVVDRIVVEESRVVIQHVVPTGAVRLQTEQQSPKKGYFTAYVSFNLWIHMLLQEWMTQRSRWRSSPYAGFPHQAMVESEVGP